MATAWHPLYAQHSAVACALGHDFCLSDLDWSRLALHERCHRRHHPLRNRSNNALFDLCLFACSALSVRSSHHLHPLSPAISHAFGHGLGILVCDHQKLSQRPSHGFRLAHTYRNQKHGQGIFRLQPSALCSSPALFFHAHLGTLAFTMVQWQHRTRFFCPLPKSQHGLFFICVGHDTPYHARILHSLGTKRHTNHGASSHPICPPSLLHCRLFFLLYDC